jgi:hypothetical protein
MTALLMVLELRTILRFRRGVDERRMNLAFRIMPRVLINGTDRDALGPTVESPTEAHVLREPKWL